MSLKFCVSREGSNQSEHICSLMRVVIGCMRNLLTLCNPYNKAKGIVALAHVSLNFLWNSLYMEYYFNNVLVRSVISETGIGNCTWHVSLETTFFQHRCISALCTNQQALSTYESTASSVPSCVSYYREAAGQSRVYFEISALWNSDTRYFDFIINKR